MYHLPEKLHVLRKHVNNETTNIDIYVCNMSLLTIVILFFHLFTRLEVLRRNITMSCPSIIDAEPCENLLRNINVILDELKNDEPIIEGKII